MSSFCYARMEFIAGMGARVIRMNCYDNHGNEVTCSVAGGLLAHVLQHRSSIHFTAGEACIRAFYGSEIDFKSVLIS